MQPEHVIAFNISTIGMCLWLRLITIMMIEYKLIRVTIPASIGYHM